MQAVQDAMNGVWDVERARYPSKVVAVHKLWPRSIASRLITASDHESTAAQAEEQSFHKTMAVDVTFDDSDADSSGSRTNPRVDF